MDEIDLARPFDTAIREHLEQRSGVVLVGPRGSGRRRALLRAAPEAAVQLDLDHVGEFEGRVGAYLASRLPGQASDLSAWKVEQPTLLTLVVRVPPRPSSPRAELLDLVLRRAGAIVGRARRSWDLPLRFAIVCGCRAAVAEVERLHQARTTTSGDSGAWGPAIVACDLNLEEVRALLGSARVEATADILGFDVHLKGHPGLWRSTARFLALGGSAEWEKLLHRTGPLRHHFEPVLNDPDRLSALSALLNGASAGDQPPDLMNALEAEGVFATSEALGDKPELRPVTSAFVKTDVPSRARAKADDRLRARIEGARRHRARLERRGDRPWAVARMDRKIAWLQVDLTRPVSLRKTAPTGLRRALIHALRTAISSPEPDWTALEGVLDASGVHLGSGSLAALADVATSLATSGRLGRALLAGDVDETVDEVGHLIRTEFERRGLRGLVEDDLAEIEDLVGRLDLDEV